MSVTTSSISSMDGKAAFGEYGGYIPATDARLRFIDDVVAINLWFSDHLTNPASSPGTGRAQSLTTWQ
jgi:hypothetical protein